MKKIIACILALTPLATFGACLKSTTLSLPIYQVKTGTLCPGSVLTTTTATYNSFKITGTISGDQSTAQGTVSISPGLHVNKTSGPNSIQLNGKNPINAEWIIYTGDNEQALIFTNSTKVNVNFKITAAYNP